MTPAAKPRADLRESGGVLQGFGMLCLFVFLFTSYSRLTDIYLVNLNVALVTSLLALVATVITGGLPRALFSRVGLWLAALTIWLLLAVPFSAWQGGSAHLFWDQWVKSFLVFVIVAGLLRTVGQCRWTMYAIAGATVVITLMSWFLGTLQQGRLVLGDGVLSNPNDLAQLLLMGAPFVLLVGMSRGGFKRPFVALALGAVLLITASTGSRGALVAILVLIVAMFLNFSAGNRLKLLGAVIMTALVVLPLLSPAQRLRYLTLVEQGSEEDLGNQELSAIGSREQRLELLKQSIDLTITHPLFGVGPGQFQTATNILDEEQGLSGMWKESHNAYTQVSSEAGIPALVFYLGALLACLKMTRSIYKNAREQPGLAEITNVSYCLWLSLIAFAVTAFFSSVAYHVYLPLLAGLSVALSLSVPPELLAARVITAPQGARPRPLAPI